jgi:DNA polymerase (family 10)
MAVQNADIAAIFNQMADLLEIQGANPFRVRAYRNAARTVSDLPRPVKDMLADDKDLRDLPGIGEDLAGKIEEIVQTGRLAQLDELEQEIAPELSELMTIEGLGPQRVQALHKALGIQTLDDLQQAAENGAIREVEGFGAKTEEKIRQAVKDRRDEPERLKWILAEQRARDMVAYLEKAPGIERVEVAGSFRRCKETVGDLDILVICRKGPPVMDHFTSHEDVREVVSKGRTRSTVVLKSGLQVDVRVIPKVSYGAALHYFTGSKAHNVAVRRRAQGKKLKINEYGVFRGEERIAGRSEEDVYRAVELPYIPPELREDRGEIEAAEAGTLPDLIVLDDIRGDLHAHTKATDGKADLEDMVAAARQQGYAYLAITEHSKRVTMAHGLDEKGVAEHIARIDRCNASNEDFTVLKGLEVDILKDGALDLPDDILAQLDFRICSVHYHQNLSGDRQTERILKAMQNPYCNIVGHPTGRLIGERPPYEVDMQQIMKAARDRGCFLELNAHPDRLDLNDRHCRMAREIGVGVVISTDAHSTTDLEFMRLGVAQARRGWLRRKDVINTRPLDDLLAAMKRS